MDLIYILFLFFREIQENNMLLKEKAESLERKLERAEKIYTDAAHLDTENLVCFQML